MGPYFKEWSDGDGHPPRINSQTWHRRLARTPCTECKKPYLPAMDRQRFCEDCDLWYHIECLGEQGEVDFDPPEVDAEVDASAVDEEGLPAVWKSVLAAPTVRGHNGEYDFESSWLITGSGTQKKIIKDSMESKEVPDGWEALFGENFLADLLSKDFRAYKCPNCDAKI